MLLELAAREGDQGSYWKKLFNKAVEYYCGNMLDQASKGSCWRRQLEKAAEENCQRKLLEETAGESSWRKLLEKLLEETNEGSC